MKKIGVLLLTLATGMPFALSAGGVSGGNENTNWTIYGWQNWSYEFVEVDGHGSIDPNDSINPITGGNERTRDLTRISNNAANIGFAANIDTGVSVAGTPVIATFQCEQFTFHNRFVGSGFFGFNDFCNRNSKIGLKGPWGEVMFANWLLPHNEMVAAWVDPFYDAGADSHTSIMGSVGYGTRFFNGGFGFDNGGGFGGVTNFGDDDTQAADSPGGFGAQNNAFNRRQNGVIQWMSPNWNGFTARVATTSAQQDSGFQYFNGNDEIQIIDGNGDVQELDPRIWSAGVAYTKDVGAGNNIWLAATYEKHDEWAAVDFQCADSDDDSWRVAGRYIHDFGTGMTAQISAMYEDIEYDHEDCLNTAGPLGGNNKFERDAWMVSGKLNFAGPLDFRFSYMSADDFDCDGGDCNGISDDSTDADAFNLGLFYTMPAGTELRVTYSEVDNSSNANYDFGISPAGTVPGGDLEMVALGIVQWF